MKNLTIFLALSFLFWAGYRITAKVHAEQDYLGYLERAGNANSVEMAKGELLKATKEIERQNLTSGYTSVVYKTPDEDISFWYKNLKNALSDLERLPKNSSPLEQSNVLIKLRESLMDKEELTYPAGISVYPNNGIIMFWGWVSGVLTIVFFIITGIKNDWFEV